MGRDSEAVWGELGFADKSEPFRFRLHTNRLTIGAPGDARSLLLDEMGVEVASPDHSSEQTEP